MKRKGLKRWLDIEERREYAKAEAVVREARADAQEAAATLRLLKGRARKRRDDGKEPFTVTGNVSR